MKISNLIFLSIIALNIHAQEYEVVKLDHMQNKTTTSFKIPDIEGYKTLKCDFHNHTVFSDGHVTPQFRIDEAINNDLDVIALTDHIEYKPNKKYISTDLNASNSIAEDYSKKKDIVYVKGIEITRKKPFGHFNALFIEDGNAIKDDNELTSLENAIKQDAVIMWNHPGWPDDNSEISDIHKKLLKEGKIDMIEIVNFLEYYPKAASYAHKYNLAYSGNSDCHKPINWEYGSNIRPMTLVFATDKNAAAVKEGIKQKRTVALFDNKLFGSEKYLGELVKSCLSYSITKEAGNKVKLKIKNDSDIIFKVENAGTHFTIPQSGTINIEINSSKPLVFDNCFITATKHLTINKYTEL